MDYVTSHVPKDGLYPNYISPGSGSWGARMWLSALPPCLTVGRGRVHGCAGR